MSGKVIRSVFLPYGEGNPYPAELARALGVSGATVERPSCGWYFLSAVMGKGSVDILHLHWLEMFFYARNNLIAFAKLVVFLIQVLIVKVKGVRIVWTVHNIEDHEGSNPRLNRFCIMRIAGMADAIIVHSEWAKKEIVERAGLSGSEKVFVIPHGNYIQSYRNVVSRSDARKELGIDDSSFVYLFLGAVRRYKGVLELIDAFKKINNTGRILVIAGKPFDSIIEEEVKSRINGYINIKFFPDVVPNDKVQVYINACNVVIFPFRNITTSGSVVLAMSFGRACIAPRLGGIGEVLRENVSLLYDVNDESGLSRCMNEAASGMQDLDGIGKANLRLTEEWDWGHIGKLTMDVYKGLF